MKTRPHKSTTTPEAFHHSRASFDADHGRKVQARTAFVRQDRDGQWYVSYAECDERDQFCKKAGRQVARRKWFDGKRVQTTGPSYEEAFFPKVLVH
jgi:hypothetical protein